MKKLNLDLEPVEFSTNPVFDGPNGQALLDLQKSYGEDPRFKLDSRFVGDVELDKLPKDLKDKFESLPVNDEKGQMLKLLGEVVPSACRYRSSTTSSQIKRFDPTRPNQNLVSEVQPQKEPQKELQKEPKKKNKKKKPKKKHKKELLAPDQFRKKAPKRKVQPQVNIQTQLFKEGAGEFRLFS